MDFSLLIDPGSVSVVKKEKKKTCTAADGCRGRQQYSHIPSFDQATITKMETSPALIQAARLTRPSVDLRISLIASRMKEAS